MGKDLGKLKSAYYNKRKSHLFMCYLRASLTYRVIEKMYSVLITAEKGPAFNFSSTEKQFLNLYVILECVKYPNLLSYSV